MAIEIKHLFESNVPDGEDNNLVQPSDWNANHVLSGGGVFRVPQLIEEKTLPAGTTSVTFSGLDGDSDKEYLCEFNLIIVLGNGGAGLIWKPNNSSSNQDAVQHRYHSTWDGYSGGNVSRLVYQGTTGDTVYCSGYFIFNAKTGSIRTWRGHSTSYISSPTLGHSNSGVWTDTGTNLTSIVILPDVGTFSGTIRLYKMVDLNLGGE